MKHFLKVLLILFYCNTNLKANSNDDFQAGYIISLKGDTTKGFLLKQISREASEKCIFKPNTDSETKSYLPGEIEGYRFIDGKYYISKEIKIDSITKKVVFLEFLIKGIASLYYYVDNDEHYYLEKFPNGLFELTEKQRTINDGNHVYISPSRFKGKLLAVLQDCPDITNEIQNTRLDHESLIKLTKDYHEKICNSESCIIYERHDRSVKVKFGVLMGCSKNQYNFGGELLSNYGNNYQIGAAFKVSNIFMSNGHFNIKANFIFEKDSKSYTLTKSEDAIYYSVTYNNVTYRLDYYDKIDAISKLQADLNVFDLKIPIILNFDFNITQKTIYTFGIGISNKIILSQNKNFQIEDFYAHYGKSINSLLTGVVATTGIEGAWFGKHSVFVNVTYEYLPDLRSQVDASLKLINNQYSLQIGMYF